MYQVPPPGHDSPASMGPGVEDLPGQVRMLAKRQDERSARGASSSPAGTRLDLARPKRGGRAWNVAGGGVEGPGGGTEAKPRPRAAWHSTPGVHDIVLSGRWAR